MAKKLPNMMDYKGVSFATKNWVWSKGDLELMQGIIDKLLDNLYQEETIDVFIFAVIFEYTELDVFIHAVYYTGDCETWVNVLGMSEI